MTQANPRKYLPFAMKARLNAQLTAVETLTGPIAVPTWEWGAQYNEPYPYVVISVAGGDMFPNNTANSYGNIVDVNLWCVAEHKNQGLFLVESIVDAVMKALTYRPPSTINPGGEGVRLDLPGFLIFGAEANRVPIPGGGGPDDRVHRRLIEMRYNVGQNAG